MITYYLNTQSLYKYSHNNDDVFYKVLGNNLKILRSNKNFTQKCIANYLHISYQQYQKYESGINRMPLKFVLQLIHFFKIEPHELLGNSGKNLTESIYKKIDKNHQAFMDFKKENKKFQESLIKKYEDIIIEKDNEIKSQKKRIKELEKLLQDKS